MAEELAKSLFSSLYNVTEKKRQKTASEPFSQKDINTLMSIYINKEPLYPAMELFYSEEYTQALEKGITGEELEKICRFRKPNESELNLLFCDIHMREEKANYSGSNQSDG